MQFHPEFDAETMRAYLSERHQVLAEEGIDAAERTRAVVDCPDGTTILSRFAALRRD